MKISYQWLKSILPLTESPESVAEILTSTGLEVESTELRFKVEGGLAGVVIGQVKSVSKHPEADRLKVCLVEVGQAQPLQIVCGAANVAEGQKVAVAMVGTTLFTTGGPLEIKKAKIRGVHSEGMICAEDELGIGTSHDGILVLNESAETGIPASDYFTDLVEDYTFEIGLTPNRTDAMSHTGVARDLCAWLNFHKNAGLKLIHDNPEFKVSNASACHVTVEDVNGCPLYAGAVIRNVSVDASPEWLTKRLMSIGIKPINNIVDITNFVMHHLGNPLHAFDLSRVGSEIHVRKALKGEKLITLDDVERSLTTDDLVIANATSAMCIAGIFGGKDSGVSASTKDLFLEAACFNPVNVRRTSKRFGLSTDSSFRFERGVDQVSVMSALYKAVQLILEIAGGKLESITDCESLPVRKSSAEFTGDKLRSFSGSQISDTDIMNILSELGFHHNSSSNGKFVVKVPVYRSDVKRPVDVFEEVLRIYGYDNIPLPQQVKSSLSVTAHPDPETILNEVAKQLTAQGFYEILNNSLGTASRWNDKVPVKLLNPLSLDLECLRTSLLPGGLRSVQHNQNRQHADLRFFEFGKIYSVDKGFKEKFQLALLMTGTTYAENWDERSRQEDFYAMKGVLNALFMRMGICVDFQTGTTGHVYFSACSELINEGKVIGTAGVIKPQILKKYDVRGPVIYAELDWQEIVSRAMAQGITYKPISKTQFIRRDFSLLLDCAVQFADIRQLAFSAESEILRKVGLFDVYEGKDLPQGMKSYAVSFIFQDYVNTLKDERVDMAMEKIRISLSEKLGAELR